MKATMALMASSVVAMGNPILEYYQAIDSGQIAACSKVRRTMKHLVEKVNDTGSEFYYDEHRGQHIIDFIETYCRHSKGKLGGQKIKLELWEKAILAAAFGFVDADGNREYREVIIIVGKKNGKSLISSAVGLYMFIADGEPGPEVYSVATKKDQAKIIWIEAKRMVLKSPALRTRIKCHVADLDASDYNDGIFKPQASDSDTLDGLNIHCVLMDEVHQWKNGRELYDIMADGITARSQPMIFITTTAGKIREDIYDEKYDEAQNIINGYDDPNGYKDDRTLAFVYELDKREEWEDERCWVKANPGLGTIKNKVILAEKVQRAKNNPLILRNLLCKEFNIPETNSEAWLSFEQIDNQATYDIEQMRPRYGIGGFDLSTTTDLTCATLLFKTSPESEIYVKQMYWLPTKQFDRRVKEDKVPYDKWLDAGWLRLSGDTKIDHHDVCEWFLECQREHDVFIPWIGYDAWSAQYLVEEMRLNFGKDALEEVRQGVRTLSAPMKSLAVELEAKKINYDNNPILKWCLTNTAVAADKNGNIQPVKTSNQRRRIDGLASLLDAYVVYDRHMQDYNNLI